MTDYPEESYSIDDEVIDIVSTPGTLGGVPRLDGHRIAVYHILGQYRSGLSVPEIASEEVYPYLSEAQVRAALHYAVDHPDAVVKSQQPPETPLQLSVSFDSQRGGPTLSVIDQSTEDAGVVSQATIPIDDLPNEYDAQDLYTAWRWMHE